MRALYAPAAAAIRVLQQEAVLGRGAWIVLQRAAERVGPNTPVLVLAERVMPSHRHGLARPVRSHRPVDDVVVMHGPVNMPRPAEVWMEIMAVAEPQRVVRNPGRGAAVEIPIEFGGRVAIGWCAQTGVVLVVLQASCPDLW